MAVRKNAKQYGLIKPSNVFGADDDSDVDDGTDWVKKALKAEGEKHKVKKQHRLDMQKALKEDPTIYQYDEVFDEMKQSEQQGKAVKKEAKKSKYIGTLLKTADRRKREQEHRIERMVQKEREAEGAMFADKESFVTSAYKSKLEELKQMEEEEKNMDRLEAIGDVTKQPDMGGFYRHFFQQTVDKSKPAESDEAAASREKPASGNNSQILSSKSNIDRDDVLASSTGSENGTDSEDDSRPKKSESHKIVMKEKQSRQYRKRVVEASESESEADDKLEKPDEPRNKEKPIENPRLKDEDSEPAKKKTKINEEEEPSIDNKSKGTPANCEIKPVEDGTSQPSQNDAQEIKTEKSDDAIEEEKKIKINIWEKRTVGPIFDAALERYYIRKANRLSGS